MQISKRVKLIVSIPSLIIALLSSIEANASCNTNTGGAKPGSVSFTQPNIVVQRDVPVGSVIGTLNTPDGGGAVFSSCATNGNIYYAMSLFTTRSAITHVYDTNLSGVGVRVGQGTSYYYESPAFARYLSYSQAIAFSSRTVDFIKTGPITSGVISSGLLARNYGDDGITAFSLNFTGGMVTEVACSINTPQIQVPLEDVLAGSLTSIGTTAKPKVFNLGLTCNAGARVNVKMTGTQNSDSSANGVLQLSGAGSAGVATGVGIQILYNNSPLALNNNILLKTSTGGQETFPFVAQYYQTKSTVTTGEANATATLNLTYQ